MNATEVYEASLLNRIRLNSDRGSQFTSLDMAKACSRHGLLRSTGATGICWDNAGSESLWSTVKHEYYKRHAFTP